MPYKHQKLYILPILENQIKDLIYVYTIMEATVSYF